MSRPVILWMLVGPAAGLLAAARGFLAAARTVLVAAMRRRVLGHLGQMDDRMLRDIGLSRQDLWSASAESMFRDPTVSLAQRAGEMRLATRAMARERIARAALVRLWAEDSRAA